MAKLLLGLSLAQVTPPCTVTEDSIFKAIRTCEPARKGSLLKGDLTLAGLSVGESTLSDVNRRFPGATRFSLTKDEGAPSALCVKNERGNAVVFASSDSGGERLLDSIYLARAATFEEQGAKCTLVSNLQPTTDSGIALDMDRKHLLSLLGLGQSESLTFSIDYTTSPDKAAWASTKYGPHGNGWVAMSGAYGGFKEGRLRWIVLYAALSN